MFQFVFLWNKQTKPNQTQPKQTKNPLFCLFVQTNCPNQTKPNFLNNKFKINFFKKIKSKVSEKLARAAQLLYRPVLAFCICRPVYIFNLPPDRVCHSWFHHTLPPPSPPCLPPSPPAGPASGPAGTASVASAGRSHSRPGTWRSKNFQSRQR